MSEADAVAVVLWLGVTLYAIFGGADFGAGLWDLTAGGPERGASARRLIDQAITPVWEANHVWLIFILVVTWTALPEPFAAIMSTLFIPLSLAAFGIVLRGSGFAFRKLMHRVSQQRALGAIFAISSVMTPFFMGTVVGAIASGRVPADGNGDRLTSWLNLTSITIGLLFVAACAYVSAIFLVVEARKRGDLELAAAFRRRAVGAAVVTGALAAAGLVVLDHDAPVLYDGLVGDALPLVILSVVCGAAVTVLLLRGAPPGTRPLGILAVATVVWGWGVAQYPYVLPDTLELGDAAAPSSTLTAVLVVFGAALLIVVPALGLLYTLAQRELLGEAEGSQLGSDQP